MKKRTAFVGALLSLIPLGQPLIIKTGAFLSTTVLINKGCPNGIKDKIAPIKAVRFFISKFTLN